MNHSCEAGRADWTARPSPMCLISHHCSFCLPGDFESVLEETPMLSSKVGHVSSFLIVLRRMSNYALLSVEGSSYICLKNRECGGLSETTVSASLLFLQARGTLSSTSPPEEAGWIQPSKCSSWLASSVCPLESTLSPKTFKSDN